MAELGKVLNALENCTAHPKCRDCGWKECEYEHETVEIPLTLAKDAHSLLKAQEPRVMTLEELEDALDTVVWLDIPNTENLADGYSLIMAYSHKNGFIFLESPFGDNPSQDRFEYKDYGITWRCWTSRPTDEQREAVKWDEPPKEGNT